MENKKHLNAQGKGEFIYNYRNDVLTFRIRDRNYRKSVEFQNFVVDIDEEDFVTGMRIFDASKVFGIDKYILRDIANGEFKASIENGVITITLKFVGRIRNKLIPIMGEKQNFTQQITTPVSAESHLKDSSVACISEA